MKLHKHPAFQIAAIGICTCLASIAGVSLLLAPALLTIKSAQTRAQQTMFEKMPFHTKEKLETLYGEPLTVYSHETPANNSNIPANVIIIKSPANTIECLPNKIVHSPTATSQLREVITVSMP